MGASVARDIRGEIRVARGFVVLSRDSAINLSASRSPCEREQIRLLNIKNEKEEETGLPNVNARELRESFEK